MVPRTRDIESLLSFLGIPYEVVSDGEEVRTQCVDCGKEGHLYINKATSLSICHRCGVANSPRRLEQKILGTVLQPNSQGTEYFLSRGLTEGTIEEYRLTYYSALNRYAIPFLSPTDKHITNISFRALDNSTKPKYIRLPGRGADPYYAGDVESKVVVITEGEIDALSVVEAFKGHVFVVGLAGATTHSKINMSLLPPSSTVYGLLDNDAAGQRALSKLKELFPTIIPVSLPEGIKDANSMLTSAGPDALRNTILEAKKEEEEEPKGVAVPSTVYIHIPDNVGDWLLEGLWMDQALGFVAGIPKAMKSLLTLHFGYHVASGKDFLGRPVLNPGPVLLFQEEDNDHIIKGRIKEINSGIGSPNLYLATPGITGHHLRLDSPHSLEFLDQEISRVRPVLVILDPLANMHNLESENDSALTNKLLEGLRHIRDFRKCSFMIVHHLRKGTGEEPSGQRMRGSSVFHAKSECAWYIDKYGALLRINIESKISPPRTIEVVYKDKSFVLENEYGGGDIGGEHVRG